MSLHCDGGHARDVKRKRTAEAGYRFALMQW